MRKIIFVFIVLAAVGAGYVLGSYFPLATQKEEGIKGNARLVVSAKTEETMAPVANLEIDLAEQPGMPPEGGVALTDENGVAEFNIAPGHYFIFFNNLTFPKNLIMPEPQQVVVQEGSTAQKEIIFELK